jgi:hypothetical protein
LTFPLLDGSEFGNFVITLIQKLSVVTMTWLTAME